MITGKELHEACLALVNWFQSQDLQPPEAGLVMARTIAMSIVAKEQPEEEMMRAVALFKKILEGEVGELLHE